MKLYLVTGTFHPDTSVGEILGKGAFIIHLLSYRGLHIPVEHYLNKMESTLLRMHPSKF